MSLEVGMNKPIKAYMAILKVELDDLEEDLKLLMEQAQERYEKGEITNYVYLENLAVFKQELFGVDGIARRFEKNDPSRYSNLDELIADLKEELLDVKSRDLLPQGVISMVERKFDKVKNYLDAGSCE